MNFGFLKTAEFWVTITITIIVTLLGGFLFGKSHYYGLYIESQEELKICNSNISDSIINSPGAAFNEGDHVEFRVGESVIVEDGLTIGGGSSLRVYGN